jgi:hypothetical protein
MLGSTTTSNKTKDNTNNNDLNDDGSLGSSYILFGRNFNHQKRFPSTISLSSSSSRHFVSEINNDGTGGAGIRNDITTRSTTIIGDVNGDGFDDLLVGYPLASKCSIYLGNGVDDFATLVLQGESFAIIGDPEQGGGFLGWSSIRIGDLNGDGLEEIAVSAINANTIYVIYGKSQFGQSVKIINIDQLVTKDGFKIVGSPDDINFGVALTLVHHFSKTGHRDLAITAQTYTGGQNIVYVLFTSELNKLKTIKMNEIMNNPDSCIKIVPPLYSFAAFSLAGIGDINSDGYDDLAIGSVPYYRGQFSKQQTFIVYGGKREELVLQELILSEMTEKQGFVITGAGFLVVGVDDVNYDGIADVLITDYQGWQGQRNAYLITSPKNMTFSPTIQPSSIPTRAATRRFDAPFRFNNNSSDGNSSFLLFEPSSSPTDLSQLNNNSNSLIKPSLAPTSKAVFAIGTAVPTSGKPSLPPSLSPTSGYFHLRGFPPTITPTLMPTINNTIEKYNELDCSKAGDYHGNRTSETNYKFSITATSGIVNIRGTSNGGAKNLFVLYCPPPGGDDNHLNVVIDNFRVSTDIISVAHLSSPGHSSFRFIGDLSYYFSKGPLTFVFCSENKLQVILSSHTSFDLTESNFLFTPTNEKHKHEKKNILSETIQLGIIGGAVFLVIVALYSLSFRKDEKNKKNDDNDYHQRIKSRKEEEEEDEEEERFQQVTNWLESSLAKNHPNRFHMLYSSPETSGRDFDIESSPVVTRETNNKSVVSNQSSESESLDFSLSSEKGSFDEKKEIGKQPPVKVDESDVNSISSGNWRDLVAASSPDEGRSLNSQEWNAALEENSDDEEIEISGYLSDSITDDCLKTPGVNKDTGYKIIPVNNVTASRQIKNEEKYPSSEESEDDDDDDDDLDSEKSSFF